MIVRCYISFWTCNSFAVFCDASFFQASIHFTSSSNAWLLTQGPRIKDWLFLLILILIILVFLILQFHVTTRLKAHNTQHLLNSLASLDFKSITPADKEHRKKDSDLRPAHGMLQKSVSDVIQSSHSSRNTQEPENIYIRQVCC